MPGPKKGARRAAAARADQEERRRRDGRHCPVCLAGLPRISGRAARRCVACAAEPAPEARCAGCGEQAVWSHDRAAACAACGRHGSRTRVLAGHAWLSRDERK
jgi:hypothetical protein